jgi:hypothetical protein
VKKGREAKEEPQGGTRTAGALSKLVGDEGDAGTPLLHHRSVLHGFTATRHQLALHRYPFAIATYGELTTSPHSPPVVFNMEPPHLSVPLII